MCNDVEVKDERLFVTSWLVTRRGLIVFILLLLMTEFSNLYRPASNRENGRQPVKASSNWDSSHREGSQQQRDGVGVKNCHPCKPVKPSQPE
ncbi:MAG: hypothetical protein DMG06_20775 [Acidobacteria bacterium]|nr:MAG: hypothetical protein DMG06_20775 [Acidobacteriota bacterium]